MSVIGDTEPPNLSPHLLQQLKDAGGAAIAHLLERAAKSEDKKFVEVLVNAAYERSWEKLHCGSWKDVLPVWRQSFGIASVLRARCLAHRQQFLESLKILDMCLMMSGPLAPSETHALIANVEKQLAMNTPEKSIEQRNVKKPRLDHETSRTNFEKKTLKFPLRRLKMPSLEKFRQNMMLQNEPAIITGAMEFWPALGRAAGPTRAWKNIEYLRQVAGLRTVPVEVGSDYLGDDWGQELMSMNEFLDRFIIPSLAKDEVGIDSSEGSTTVAIQKMGYLAQHRLFDQIPSLGRDIMIPDYCTLQRTEVIDDGEDITINSWFGPLGTVSPLHFDPKDNLLCQVVGAKYIRLYSPKESDKLYRIDGLLSNTSSVNVEDPDYVQFPKFRHAQYVECILREGEMLYIPPNYWHYVKSLSTSFSVSFWWS
ncbi:putative JmjC domain-containing protein [Plasmopara halstedii]